MKNSFLMLLAVVTAVIFSSCSDEAVAIGNESLDSSANLMASKASSSTVAVFDPFTSEEKGTSTLKRNNHGVTVNFKAEGLIPGHAYTLWWIVWNNPQNCLGYPGECAEADFAIAEEVGVDVMYAAGHVVGDDGIGNFSGHLNENDASGSINDIFGLPSPGGLWDAQTAEIHLVLRSHGPAIPGLVNKQITTYLGGCENDLGAFNGQIPMNPGECADLLASVHQLPQ